MSATLPVLAPEVEPPDFLIEWEPRWKALKRSCILAPTAPGQPGAFRFPSVRSSRYTSVQKISARRNGTIATVIGARHREAGQP